MLDHFLLELLVAREGEHALGQARASLRALNGVIKQRQYLGIVGHALAQQLEAAEHRHQQVVKIVCDAAGELADRFHLLRLEQDLTCLFEFLLGVPTLGDVARDLGVSDNVTATSANGIDDDCAQN